MQIKEFADFTGVSVRTLHYYDEIGLLPPARVDGETGYRYYDESSLLRMEEILFYRELDFSLKSIMEILSSPNYDTAKALQDQKHLLILKKERLEHLIAAIDQAIKGEPVMNAFHNTEFETYKAEAKEKWGNTAAYQEHTEKTKNYSKNQWNALTGEMDAIFAAFAQAMEAGHVPTGPVAQSLVKKLQDHISTNYYHCTDQILCGLGQMYITDHRFQTNIDRHAPNTAAFVSRAITAYCDR